MNSNEILMSSPDNEIAITVFSLLALIEWLSYISVSPNFDTTASKVYPQKGSPSTNKQIVWISSPKYLANLLFGLGYAEMYFQKMTNK